MANAYAIKFASKAIMAYYHNVAVHINKGNLEELPIVSIAQTEEKNVSQSSQNWAYIENNAIDTYKTKDIKQLTL